MIVVFSGFGSKNSQTDIKLSFLQIVLDMV